MALYMPGFVNSKSVAYETGIDTLGQTGYNFHTADTLRPPV